MDLYTQAFSKQNGPNSKMCVFCQAPGGGYGLPKACEGMEQDCNLIVGDYWAGVESCPPDVGQQPKDCLKALHDMGCDCGTLVCQIYAHSDEFGRRFRRNSATRSNLIRPPFGRPFALGFRALRLLDDTAVQTSDPPHGVAFDI